MATAPAKQQNQNKSKNKTRPCKFFPTGNCTKGAQCTFLHAQQPPPAVVVPPNALASYVEDRRSLLKDLQARRPVIPLAATDLQKHADDMGYPYWTYDKKTIGNHHFANFFRETSVRSACGDALRKLEKTGMPDEVVVLDYFGATRNTKIFSPGMPIRFRAYAPYLVAGDAARGFDRDPAPFAGHFGLVQDVYHGKDSTAIHQEPFDVPTAKEILTMVPVIYYITRNFQGEAGVEIYGSGSSTWEEAAWVKQEGLIHFSAHPGAQLYAPHRPPFFGTERSVDGLDVSELATIGPYVVYVITETLPEARPLPSVMQEEGRYVRRRLNAKADPIWKNLLPMWAQGVFKTYQSFSRVWERLAGISDPNAEKVVDLRALEQSRATVTVRPGSGLTLDSVEVNSHAFWTNDPVTKALARRFPAFTERMQQDTKDYIKYGNKGTRARHEKSLRIHTLEADEDLRFARARDICPPSGPSKKYILLAVAMAAAALYLMRKRRFSVQAGSLATMTGWGLNGLVTSLAALRSGVRGLVSNTEKFAAEVVSPALRVSGPRLFLMCVVSPVGEEVMKSILPWWASGLLFLNEAYAIQQHFGMQAALQTLTMHSIAYQATNKIHLAAGVAIHAAWNTYACLQNPVGNGILPGSIDLWLLGGASAMLLAYGVWKRWRAPQNTTPSFDQWRDDVYYEQRFSEEPDVAAIPIPAGTTLSGVDSKLIGVHEDGVRGEFSLLQGGVPMDASEYMMSSYTPGPIDNNMWLVLATSGILWKPARTAHNLVASLLHRQHRNLPSWLPPLVEQGRNWNKAIDWCAGVMGFADGDPIAFPTTLAEALVTQAPTRRRVIMQGGEDLIVQGVEPKGFSFFMKADETICSCPREFVNSLGHGSVQTIKPRTIANVPVYIHAETAQFARLLTHIGKQLFDGTPRTTEVWVDGELVPIVLQMFWCAGVSTKEGADRMLRAMAACSGNLVWGACGDDTALDWGKLALLLQRLRFEESDFTMLDSTLGAPISIDGFKRWTTLLGMPARVIDLFVESMHMRYTAKREDVFIRGDADIQFATGLMITSTHQTFISMFFLYVILANLDLTTAQAATTVGLVAKTKAHRDMFDVSFLHLTGQEVMVDGRETLVMAPLPGAIVKLGKVGKDPVVITKFKGRQALSDAEAVKQVAYAIAISHPEIPPNFPVLGAFLRKLEELGTRSERGISPGSVISNYAYKQRLTAFTLTPGQREAALARHARRYGCTPDDLVELENLIDTVDELPAFLLHPLFPRMAMIDYG
jgi:hypothetical protein